MQETSFTLYSVMQRYANMEGWKLFNTSQKFYEIVFYIEKSSQYAKRATTSWMIRPKKNNCKVVLQCTSNIKRATSDP